MGLITDLLNLTQIGSGRLVYHVGDIIARDVLAASASLVEPLVAQKLIVYEGIACDASIVARGDPEKVTQILVNLLSNAIKFTPSGGRLTIDCEATSDAVLMHISDTGLGIPKDKLEAIFDPFVQVKIGSLGPERGIGLGLAISRDLARAMEGDITVESTLGEGARFTLRLPRSSGGTL